MLKKSEVSAMDALEFIAKSCDDMDMLTKAIDSVNKAKSTSNSIDVKLKNCADYLFGKNMTVVKTTKENLDGTVECVHLGLQYVFSKASSEGNGLTMPQFEQILLNAKAYMQGKATSMAPVIAPIVQGTPPAGDVQMT
eukprot:Skav203543  [mRNA]  locus=scaffold220:72430:72843:- [translate_table: standard]